MAPAASDHKATAAAVAPADQPRPDAPDVADELLHLYLGRSAFCVCWWLVLAFHIFVGGFALSVTALHRYLQNEQVAQSLDALHVPKQTLQMTARTFFLVGLAHFVAILRLLRNSYRAKKLTFQDPVASKTTTPKERRSLRCCAVLYRIYDAVRQSWAALFSPTGVFGSSSRYFETVFMCREAGEILMQTYQAYKLSQSVPRKWINQLAVVAIFLNCVSSPLVHVLCRKQDSRRRVLDLLFDALLDCCCSVVIPLCVLLPYVRMYDTRNKGFANELLMNDVWFVNAISETRQVLVTSLPDFVSTILPQVSLLGYLMTFKNILRRRSPGVHAEHEWKLAAQTQNEGRVVSGPQPHELPAVVRYRNRLTRGSIHVARKLKRNSATISLLTHVAFVAWGFAVLGFHLDAFHNTDRHVPGCQLHVSAWHSSAFPCSVMLLNCHMDAIDGSENQTSALLDLLDRSSLQVLIFSHCQELHVPPVVAEFENLVGIEFFNATLADWPVTASIRNAAQPHVGYVYFVLTNWTSFPAGLVHDELPYGLTHFSIVASNITQLPELHDAWQDHEWISINLERVPALETLPQSFCRLDVVWLWLLGAGLTTMSRECLGSVRATTIALSGSHFEALPDAISPTVDVLLVEYANLTAVPVWLRAWYDSKAGKEVYFFGSPICDAAELSSDAELWSASCSTDTETIGGLYPWDIMVPLRPYDIDEGAMYAQPS